MNSYIFEKSSLALFLLSLVTKYTFIFQKQQSLPEAVQLRTKFSIENARLIRMGLTLKKCAFVHSTTVIQLQRCF